MRHSAVQPLPIQIGSLFNLDSEVLGKDQVSQLSVHTWCKLSTELLLLYLYLSIIGVINTS